MAKTKKADFDWKKLLELCDLLKPIYLDFNNSNQEAAARHVINRAYYSAFRKVCQHLRLKGIYDYDKNKGSFRSHSLITDLLIEIVSTPNIPTYIKNKDKRKRYRRISEQLIELKSYRKRADYNDDCIINPDLMAIRGIEIAEKILLLVDRVDNNCVYDNVIDSV